MQSVPFPARRLFPSSSFLVANFSFGRKTEFGSQRLGWRQLPPPSSFFRQQTHNGKKFGCSTVVWNGGGRQHQATFSFLPWHNLFSRMWSCFVLSSSTYIATNRGWRTYLGRRKAFRILCSINSAICMVQSGRETYGPMYSMRIIKVSV